jgi:O-antigen polymerase
MLKYLITILVITLFATVFVSEKDIPNGVIESKNYSFLLMAVPTAIILLSVLLWNDNLKIQINAIDFSLLIFLGWIVLNALLIKQINVSFALTTCMVSVILSLIFAQFLKSNKQYFLLFSGAFLLIGGVQAISGLLQLYGFQQSLHAGFKMTGSFHNPGPLGIYIAIVCCVAAGHYFFSSDTFLKNTAGIVGLLCFLVLPSTQSRSAWIAVLLGFAYLLFTKYGLKYIKQYFTSQYLNVLFFLVLISLGVGAYYFKANSALGRILTWQVGLNMVKQNPFTGIGYGEFAYQYGFYQADFFKNSPPNPIFIALADKNGYAFNDYLQTIIENGFIGLILLLSIIGFVLFSKPSPAQTSTFIYPNRAGIIAILGAACFSYPFELITLWWLLLFFISMVSAEMESLYLFSIPSKPLKLSLMVMFCIFSVIFLKNTLISYQTKQIIKQADDVLAMQDFDEAIKHYEEVLTKTPDERLILVGYGKALYMNGNFKKSVRILEKASHIMADPFLFSNLGDAYQATHQFELAERAYKKSSEIIPNRMYPKYSLAKMYLKQHDTLRAKQTAKQIMAMPVKVSSQAITQMKREMNQLLN